MVLMKGRSSGNNRLLGITAGILSLLQIFDLLTRVLDIN